MSSRNATSDDVRIAIEVISRYGHLTYTDAVETVSRESGYAMRTVYDKVHRARTDPRTIGGIAHLALQRNETLDEVAQQYSISVNEVQRFLEVFRRDVARQESEADALNEPIPRGTVLKGTSKLYDENGVNLLTWVKTDTEKQSWLDLMERLVDYLSKRVPSIEPIPYNAPYSSDDLLTLYPLADLHIGLYASASEGGTAWNLERAITTYKTLIRDLIQRSPYSTTAIVANLGDFTHADNGTNRTPKSGAVLDVSGRYAESVEGGLEVALFTIDEALEHHQYVKVVWLKGNHDPNTGVFFNAALKKIYRDNSRVEIVSDFGAVHVEQWHEVALGFTHGDTIKMANLPLLMATKYPQIWANSTFRTFHTGHIHHEVVKEFNGCIVEAHRSPSARDSWHEAQGYGAGRSIKSIIYNWYGEYARNIINL